MSKTILARLEAIDKKLQDVPSRHDVYPRPAWDVATHAVTQKVVETRFREDAKFCSLVGMLASLLESQYGPEISPEELILAIPLACRIRDERRRHREAGRVQVVRLDESFTPKGP